MSASIGHGVPNPGGIQNPGGRKCKLSQIPHSWFYFENAVIKKKKKKDPSFTYNRLMVAGLAQEMVYLYTIPFFSLPSDHAFYIKPIAIV